MSCKTMMKIIFISLTTTAIAHAQYVMGYAPLGNSNARARTAVASDQARQRSIESHGYFAYEQVAKAYDYRALSGNWGRALYAPVHFVPLPPLSPNKKFQDFLETLEAQKAELMNYFNISNRDYNKMAVMALGIVGQESRFFDHWLYELKEIMPDYAISIARQVRTGDWGSNPLRSRGGIQMKEMPSAVGNLYSQWRRNEDLHDPESSAVAIIVYLVNAREEALRMARRAGSARVNENNVFDYMPYIYMGSGRKLVALLATPANVNVTTLPEAQRNNIAIPWENTYVQNIRSYMGRFVVTEAIDFNLLGAAHDMAIRNPAILP